VIGQLNKTLARVSLLELLMSSKPHQESLVKALNEAHVAQDISVEGFNGIVNNITANNYLTFAKEEIWCNLTLQGHWIEDSKKIGPEMQEKALGFSLALGKILGSWAKYEPTYLCTY